MLLQLHHITDLYTIVDDIIPEEEKPKGGRPQILKNSELVTILIWNALTSKLKLIKDIYKNIKLYLKKEFLKVPKYVAFVYQCHRIIPLLISVLERLLRKDTKVRIMDSTMIPVCKLHRVNRYKVAKNLASYGKNHQGWHYGFKLHASIDSKGRFCGLSLTPASKHDAQEMPRLLNKHTKVAVGDGGYTASVMKKAIFEKYGTIVISPPHHKQKKKMMAWWQGLLLKMRPKIESVFDYLKEHLNLVTSFPRSVKGYLFHYVRILLGYQFMVS